MNITAEDWAWLREHFNNPDTKKEYIIPTSESMINAFNKAIEDEFNRLNNEAEYKYSKNKLQKRGCKLPMVEDNQRTTRPI